MMMTHVSNGSQKEDKRLLQWQVVARSVTAWWQSQQYGQNLWAFAESYTANDSRMGRSILVTMMDNRKTRGFRILPPRWVSAKLLYIWVSARRWLRRCSQNLHRPFLRAV